MKQERSWKGSDALVGKLQRLDALLAMVLRAHWADAKPDDRVLAIQYRQITRAIERIVGKIEKIDQYERAAAKRVRELSPTCNCSLREVSPPWMWSWGSDFGVKPFSEMTTIPVWWERT